MMFYLMISLQSPFSANAAPCAEFSIQCIFKETLPCYHKIIVVSSIQCVQYAIISVKVSSLNKYITILNGLIKIKLFKTIGYVKKISRCLIRQSIPSAKRVRDWPTPRHTRDVKIVSEAAI